MKTLYLFISLFSIPLVNGVDYKVFDLEQNVEDPSMIFGNTYTSDMDIIKLESPEVQASPRNSRSKAIIALAVLAVLLTLTFYAIYKLKRAPEPEPLTDLQKCEKFEEELAKFREHIKELEELPFPELEERELRRLTKGQSVTLEEIEDHFKNFKEGRFDRGRDFFFFEQDIKEKLMEFFVKGLVVGDELNQKIKDFEGLFKPGFFNITNHSYRTHYIFETGGGYEYEGDHTKPSTPRVYTRRFEYDYTKKNTTGRRTFA